MTAQCMYIQDVFFFTDMQFRIDLTLTKTFSHLSEVTNLHH